MVYLISVCVSFASSLLTFFSGFGLGTLLTPMFAFFFPLPLAISLTALVHFLNNIFKLVLLKAYLKRKTILWFGLPAVGAAFLGAWFLERLSQLAPLFSYDFSGKTFVILPIKVIMALLIIFFTILELIPTKNQKPLSAIYLPIGGILSGFFGGLSGHQGALRSAFLIRAGLSKEEFLAAGVAIACLVDVTRLFVYAHYLRQAGTLENVSLLVFSTLAAFAGAYFGSQLLKKLTIRWIQNVVSIALCLFAIALGAGLI